MNKTYIITYILWILLSGAVAVEAWRLDFGSFVRPGPGFVPFLAAVTMGALAVVALVQTFLERSAASAEPIFSRLEIPRVLLIIAVLVAYILLWNALGFLAATFFLLLYLYRAVEPLRWRTVSIAAVLTLLAAHLLFSTMLGTRLPAGRIWTYFMN